MSFLVSQSDYMSTDDLGKDIGRFIQTLLFVTYLSLEFEGKYYVATTLILGTTDAVFAFTKILRPIVHYLRA